MILDIHSHIIPGIDDGSKNMEMTLEMLRNAEKDGTTEIIATPHYLLEYGETVISEVRRLVEEITSIIDSEGICLKIYGGQEVYYTKNIVQDFLEGKIGTLNDSNYMLIEFPVRKFDEDILDVIYELQVRNITPIIAHPERYKPIIERPSEVNKFMSEGYLFQMDSGSLEGKFGSEVKKTAEIFLKNGAYNFIGSDAHNTKNRTTGLSKTINLINKYDNNIKCILEDSSRKFLRGEHVNFLGERIKGKKTIFSIFKK